MSPRNPDQRQPKSANGRSAGIAAFAIATGKTVAEAAAEAEKSERTLYRWLKLPKFQKRVAEIRNRLIGAAVGKLATVMTEAAETLAGLMKSGDEAVKLRAAKSVLEITLKIRTEMEIEERLKAVEERLAGGTR
jgi:hypothetical protein